MLDDIVTNEAPSTISCQRAPQKMLGYNERLQIDVFSVGNPIAAYQYGADSNDGFNEALHLSHLWDCATILYQFSQELSVEIGTNRSDDERLIEALRNSISQNISNPDVLINEILGAWNSLAGNGANQRDRSRGLNPFPNFLEHYVHYVVQNHDMNQLCAQLEAEGLNLKCMPQDVVSGLLNEFITVHVKAQLRTRESLEVVLENDVLGAPQTTDFYNRDSSEYAPSYHCRKKRKLGSNSAYSLPDNEFQVGDNDDDESLTRDLGERKRSYQTTIVQ